MNEFQICLGVFFVLCPFIMSIKNVWQQSNGNNPQIITIQDAPFSSCLYVLVIIHNIYLQSNNSY